jgi:glutamate receptor, ionotropic, invertebrate
MQELLKKYDNKGHTVTVRRLEITDDGNFRPQLRRVKHSGDKNIIISSSIEALPEILKQAQQVGLLTEDHQFIITCLDMHTIDLEPFQHSGANITGVRMVAPDDPMVIQMTQFFAEKYAESMEKQGKKSRGSNDDDDDDDEDGDDEDDEDDVPEGLTAEKMRLDTALTFDALLLFSEAVDLDDVVNIQKINCDDGSLMREHGISDSMLMKTLPVIKGMTGNIHFDQKGHRSRFQVEVLELDTDGLKKIGTWNTTDGLDLERAHPVADESILSLRNKTFLVLTALVRLKVTIPSIL